MEALGDVADAIMDSPVLGPLTVVYFLLQGALTLVLLFLAKRYYFPSMDIDPRDKAIVVTGAASGFGAETVRQLLAKGCYVYALDINEAALKEQFGNTDRVFCMKCDVTDVQSIEAAANRVRDIGHEVFALFNNAGIATPPEALVNMSDERMTRVLDTNALSLYRVTKAFWPLLSVVAKKKKRPIVVNMTSVAGLLAAPFMGNYAMSKFAGEAFSDSLRRELKPLGVRVAIIEPFFAATRIIDNVEDSRSADKDAFFDRIQFGAATVRRLNMMGPDRVASTVVRTIFTTHCKTRTIVAKPLDRLTMWAGYYSPARVVDFVIVTLAGLKTRRTVKVPAKTD